MIFCRFSGQPKPERMTKKFGWYVLTIMLLMSITMLSCKKDKEETPEPVVKSSQITYKGSNYPIDKGACVFWSKKEPGSMITLIFLSPGGKFETSNGTIDSISGQGTGFALFCRSADSLTLVPGTYVYDTTGMNTAGTFSDANMVLNYDFANDIGEEVEFQGGTLSVAKSGSEWEVTFTGQDANGNAMTFYYKGLVPEYGAIW